MINAVERFTEIHGKQTHGFTIRVNLDNNRRCAAYLGARLYSCPVGKMSWAQMLLNSVPRVNVIHALLKCAYNYRDDVDSSVVCLSLGNVNLGEGGSRELFFMMRARY